MGDATRTTGTILDRILASRRERLDEARREAPLESLAARIAELEAPLDFARVLRDGGPGALGGVRLRLVAEIKRASPSKGVFDERLDAPGQARRYREAGAAAISVLTEPDHFRGSLADLAAVRRSLGAGDARPALLRKDFLFDPYQVLEARAAGADSLLLIVAMLQPAALGDLLAGAREEGLEPLVEVHDEAELETALDAGARVIGVNNRDLRTFEEDLAVFERLAPAIPPAVTAVAESAIRTEVDAARMADAGAHAILVGEALVRSGDVTETARALMRAGGAV